jgi:hypothetical protein
LLSHETLSRLALNDQQYINCWFVNTNLRE